MKPNPITVFADLFPSVRVFFIYNNHLSVYSMCLYLTVGLVFVCIDVLCSFLALGSVLCLFYAVNFMSACIYFKGITVYNSNLCFCLCVCVFFGEKFAYF